MDTFLGELQVSLLRLRIKDERFTRYIVRMLKAGVLSEGELRKTDEGTPQGSCVSPVLANIFAHYALDQWFNATVVKHVAGRVAMFRYCDDFVISCEHRKDADRIVDALRGRVDRFSLKLNSEKTKVVSFSKNDFLRGVKQDTFDFLGFSFHWGRTKKGIAVPRVGTSKKRMQAKLKAVKEWCRSTRHKRKLAEQWDIFRSKLRGHIQYYGVPYNTRAVANFVHQSTRIFFKWHNKRSQKKSFNWDSFSRFTKARPLPEVRVCHRMF